MMKKFSLLFFAIFFVASIVMAQPAMLLFQIDMQDQIDAGTFNSEAGDQLWMMCDQVGDDVQCSAVNIEGIIWQAPWAVFNPVFPIIVDFQFYILPATGGQIIETVNHNFQFTDTRRSIDPPVKFNKVSVTFRVDMNVYKTMGGFVTQDTATLHIQGLETIKMVPDNSTGNAGKWKKAIYLEGTGSPILYKYGINEIEEIADFRTIEVPTGGMLVDSWYENLEQVPEAIFNVDVATYPDFNPGTNNVYIQFTGGNLIQMNQSSETHYSLPVVFSQINTGLGVQLGTEVNYHFMVDDVSGGTEWAYTIAAGSVNVPEVSFSYVPDVNVTFQVDMSVQIEMENFNAAADTLEVRGDFNGWSTGWFLFDEDNDQIYTGTFGIDAGEVGHEFGFKYFYTNYGDYGYENRDNRIFTLDAAGNVLDAVFFDDRETSCGDPVYNKQIMYQVDMTVQMLSGMFNPDEGDILMIRGGFAPLAWEFSASYPDNVLTEDEPGSTIYKIVVEYPEIPSACPVEYKFIMLNSEQIAQSQAGEEYMGTWEEKPGGGNYSLLVDELQQQVAPIRYFSDVGPDDILIEETDIIWQVDLKQVFNDIANLGSYTSPSGELITSVDCVYVAGTAPFKWVWDFPLSQSEDLKMVDDGTNMDHEAGDHIYTLLYNFPAGTTANFMHKFGINGLDNEMGYGENHYAPLSTAGGDGYCWLPIEIFGDDSTYIDETYMSVEAKPVDYLPQTYSLTQNYPNPFNPTTTFTFDISAANNVRIDLYNVAGQKIQTLVNDYYAPGVYEVNFNGSHLPSGVYFYKMISGNFVQTKKMALIK
jgi:hypothetical protein